MQIALVPPSDWGIGFHQWREWLRGPPIRVPTTPAPPVPTPLPTRDGSKMVTMNALKNLRRRVMRLVTEDDGPTAVEYAVMLALILGVCAATVQVMADATRDNFSRSADAIVSATN